MKRASSRLLDHVLLSVWTVLGLTVLGWMVTLAVPRALLSEATMMEGTVALLSTLTTLRWLIHWNASPLVGVALQATCMTVAYLFRIDGQAMPSTMGRVAWSAAITCAMVAPGAPVAWLADARLRWRENKGAPVVQLTWSERRARLLAAQAEAEADEMMD